MRLPWLSITPLGAPVEPDVYWRKARVSLRSGGLRQVGEPSAGVSVESQVIASSSGASSKNAPAISRIVEVVSTTRGLASATMPRRRGRERARRLESGG